jgi:hypothetical protein
MQIIEGKFGWIRPVHGWFVVAGTRSPGIVGTGLGILGYHQQLLFET